MKLLTTIMISLVWISPTSFCGIQVREQTVIIPAKLKSSWISIEYENPRCQKLDENQSSRKLIIPESGYLCTSSEMWDVRHDDFYMVDMQGETKQVDADEQIHTRYTISPPEGCHLKAEEFWFGDRGTESGASSFVNKYHP